MIKRIRILFVAAFALTGCATSTTTYPDGRKVVVRTSDPKTIKAITRIVGQAAAAGVSASIESYNQRP